MAGPGAGRAQPPAFFDGFPADNGALPANDYQGFFLWNVTEGSVDLVSADALNTNRFVDLAGSAGDPGRFATRLPITFAARTIYALRFDYRSSGGPASAAASRIGDKRFIVSSLAVREAGRQFG